MTVLQVFGLLLAMTVTLQVLSIVTFAGEDGVSENTLLIHRNPCIFPSTDMPQEPGKPQVFSPSVYQGPSKRPLTSSFPITFLARGLPQGTVWGVMFNGTLFTSPNASITLTEPNGTYSYSVATPISGGHVRQFVSNASGIVHTPGPNETFTISSATQYYVQISVSPSGAGTVTPASGWYDANASISLAVRPFPGYRLIAWVGQGPDNYSGIASGSTVTLTGTLVETAILSPSVTFVERGLPQGTVWGVMFNGTLFTSPNASITLTEPNGTYSYSVATPISGGHGRQFVSNASGIVHTPGPNETFTISYATQYYVQISVSPSGAGTVTPASGWYDANVTIHLIGTSHIGYLFVSWVGTGNESYSGLNEQTGVKVGGTIVETAIFGWTLENGTIDSVIAASLALLIVIWLSTWNPAILKRSQQEKRGKLRTPKQSK